MNKHWKLTESGSFDAYDAFSTMNVHGLKPLDIKDGLYRVYFRFTVDMDFLFEFSLLCWC